ncbi:MAG: tetratricopeptide repeat protein, partial [Steroidobacter sp.]
VWIRGEKFADAEALLRNTLELFTGRLPIDHQYVASAEYYLGEALVAQKKLANAERVLTASIERCKRNGAPAWRSARSVNALGEIFHQLGRSQDAERYLVDSYRVLIAAPAADQDSKRLAQQRITRFYTELKQRNKLDALLRERAQENVSPAAAKGQPPAASTTQS